MSPWISAATPPPSRATARSPVFTSSGHGTMSNRRIRSPRAASCGSRLWPRTPEDPVISASIRLRAGIAARLEARRARRRRETCVDPAHDLLDGDRAHADRVHAAAHLEVVVGETGTAEQALV